MFGALWRHLPGPVWVRVIEAIVLFIILVAVLFLFVFPWIAENTRIFDSVVTQ